MKKMLVAAAVAVGAFTAPAQAEIVDVSVGDNSFRAALYGPLNRFISDVSGQYDIGVVIRPKTSDDALVTHIGALVTGDAGMKSMDLAAGLGVRGVYAGVDHDSGGALAMGGQAEARFPGFDRVGFSVYAYGAPEQTSFGELEKYYEIGTGVDYQLLKGASIYAGWRQIKMTFGDPPAGVGEIDADKSVHLGLRLNF